MLQYHKAIPFEVNFSSISIQFPSSPPLGEGPMSVQPGSLVRIHSRAESLYEVMTVEDDDLRCWVRRWPQPRTASAAFPVPISQVEGPIEREPTP